MKRWLPLLVVFSLVLIISACGGNENDSSEDDAQEDVDTPIENNDDDSAEESDMNEDEITVVLNDPEGNEVAEAKLTAVDEGVKIHLKGGAFAEGTKHAFHVHEKGVCDPDDFESAGGHYNPMDKNHGKEDADGPHAGDFDNIETNADGELDVEIVTDQISLDEGAENTIFTEDGTSLVIHAEEDDYKSQPAGDAGDRIACGVIAEPK